MTKDNDKINEERLKIVQHDTAEDFIRIIVRDCARILRHDAYEMRLISQDKENIEKADMLIYASQRLLDLYGIKLNPNQP